MIKVTLADCRRVYESYFGKKMPGDMPYATAAQKVLDEIGSKRFRALLIKVQKGKDNPAKSVAQQKLFAIALGIKKGQISRSYSAEAAKMADRMSVRKLEEFARTSFHNPRKTTYGHIWRRVVFYDTHNVGYQCSRCGDWRLKEESGNYPCSKYNLSKNPKLQQNLLPELGAAVLAGAGLGIGYKSVNAVWNKVTGKKKNPIAFECGRCGSSDIIRQTLRMAPARSGRKFDARQSYYCRVCGHIGSFFFKYKGKSNPGEAYHRDRAAMFEGFSRTSGIKALSRQAKRFAENEIYNANMSKDLGMPNPQTCPKCGKVYHDDKWGGCGKCECGYYFHPEWYGKRNTIRKARRGGR